MKSDELWLQLQNLLTNPWWRVALILGLAVFAAIVVRLIVIPILYRLARKTASDLDDRIFKRLTPAMLQSVVLIGGYWAAIDYVTDVEVERWISGAAATLLIMIWGRVILDVGQVLFKQLSEQAGRFEWVQPQTLPLIQFGFKVIVIGLQIYLIMSAWDISLTSWLASAGVLGIAVGFAAKDTLANFISGIFILVDAPYKVGQYIIIDDVTRGVVTDIGMRSTRLLTRDNVEVTVPNAVIGNAKIVNESSGPSPKMRVRVNVSAAYGSDVDQVKEILLECTKDVPNTVDPHRSSVRLVTMAESGLDFQMLVWVGHPVFRGRVIDVLNTRAYKVLGDAGIDIPFPQRDIHIKQWPGSPQPTQEFTGPGDEGRVKTEN